MSTSLRQIILDTETTGRETAEGHRIIEIGCIEVINRRLTGQRYQQYINPERLSDTGALAVHGLEDTFLRQYPLFSAIVDEFLAFVRDSQLIIHNAAFDIGFLDYELRRAGKRYGSMADYCTVLDTLPLARQMHPGQRNSLDALCKRYTIDNTHRELHGALLDAELLARVYLAMTGGQKSLFADIASPITAPINIEKKLDSNRAALAIIYANNEELDAHQQRIAALNQSTGGKCVWDAG